ncbi:MAG: MBL fold metallo-hydrolase [Lachnospiraceae bacterium]|nr:MBL fold metallo-hydrolase [Lachnospiraceae bacterium]
MRITILGVRGSIPIEGERVREFGGATSCVLVEAGGQNIFLDAGTGMLNTPALDSGDISILITHSHMDHLLGLPFFPSLYISGKRVDIYLRTRNGLTAKGQIDSLFSPPAWPCLMEDNRAEVVYHDLECPFMLGDVKVRGMEGNHPGGSTVYRLEYNGASFVYATDFEYSEDAAKELIEFAGDTDLLIFDSQYTDEEYTNCKGFGHSTAASGLSIYKRSRAKKLRFFHHAPNHDDEFLRRLEADVIEKNGGGDAVLYARQGEVIEL